MKNEEKTEKFTCGYCHKIRLCTPERLRVVLAIAEEKSGKQLTCSSCQKAMDAMNRQIEDADDFTDWSY